MKRGSRYAGRWSRMTLSRQTLSKQKVASSTQCVKPENGAEENDSNNSTASPASLPSLNRLYVLLESDFEKDPFFALDHFQSQILATTLEDVIQSVHILEEGNTQLRIMKMQDDMPMYTAKKYGIPVEERREPNSFKDYDAFQLKLHKLQNDRQNFTMAMEETYKCLVLERGFKFLSKYVHGIDEQKGRAYLLELDEVNNKIQARGLRRRVRQQRNYYKTAEYDLDLVLEKLRMQIQDAELTEAVRERYVDRWQGARAQQLDMLNKQEQDEHSRTTEYYKKRTEYEQIINREIETHMSMIFNETLIKVDDIMKKYDRDLEAIDLKIQIKRNQYAEILEKRVEMEQRYKKQAKTLKRWLKFKEDRELAQKYQKDMAVAATAIQAWWRGLLVRKPWVPKHTLKLKKRGVK